jgi:hypothetical protein
VVVGGRKGSALQQRKCEDVTKSQGPVVHIRSLRKYTKTNALNTIIVAHVLLSKTSGSLFLWRFSSAVAGRISIHEIFTIRQHNGPATGRQWYGIPIQNPFDFSVHICHNRSSPYMNRKPIHPESSSEATFEGRTPSEATAWKLELNANNVTSGPCPLSKTPD